MPTLKSLACGSALVQLTQGLTNDHGGGKWFFDNEHSGCWVLSGLIKC